MGTTRQTVGDLWYQPLQNILDLNIDLQEVPLPVDRFIPLDFAAHMAGISLDAGRKIVDRHNVRTEKRHAWINKRAERVYVDINDLAQKLGMELQP